MSSKTLAAGPAINGLNPPATLPPAWRNWKPDADATESPAPLSFRAFLDYSPELRIGVPPVWEFPSNDDGRAAYFLEHFGHMVRWVPEMKQWRVWHGQKWHPDTTGRMGYYCQILSRNQLKAAVEYRALLADQLAARIAAGDDATPPQEKLTAARIKEIYNGARSQAASLGNEKTITSLLGAAARAGEIVVPSAQWDSDPWLLGTENGTLDLRTRKHRAGSSEDYITKSVSAAYDPVAVCPGWREFIARILPDWSVAGYIQKLVGYTLTGSTSDQSFLFCYGAGKNGKSIFFLTLARLFMDYAGNARSNLIEDKPGKDCNHDLAQLPGVRFLHNEETRQGSKLREEVIKAISAGSEVSGERKFKDHFSFIPVAKLWISGNYKPRIEGTDPGIWRRVRLIPFLQSISAAEEILQDVLLARFAGEASGILNWALEGLEACPAAGGKIPIPAPVQEATAEYRQSEDDLGDFIRERTIDTEGWRKETKQAVFETYLEWAKENGIRYQLTQKQLTRQLKERAGWKMDSNGKSWLGKIIAA